MKWMSNPEVKDKSGLQEARRKIEVEMERFKAFERESKTKPFSLVGLAMSDRLDAREAKKQEKREPLEEFVEKLNVQTEEFRAEWEALVAKKKKNREETERMNHLKKFIDWHAFHLRYLEQLLRRLDNDVVDPDDLDSLIESLVLYFEQFEDPDFYHDEGLYDQFSLDSDAVDATYYNPTLEEGTGAEVSKQSSGSVGQASEPPKFREVPLTAAAKAKAKKQAAREMEAAQTGGPVRPDHPSQPPPKPTRLSMPTILPPPLPAAPHPPARPAPILPDLIIPDRPAQGYPTMSVWNAGSSSTQNRSPPPPPPHKGRALTLLELSLTTKPECFDLVRSRTSQPSNPYVHVIDGRPCYSGIHVSESAFLFRKIPLDALMVMFYYREGTYAQFLASQELKRQGWRFHKKFGLWFRRLESGLKNVNPAFEHGIYNYFDITPEGWGLRTRSDFTFEYDFLEDETVNGILEPNDLAVKRPAPHLIKPQRA